MDKCTQCGECCLSAPCFSIPIGKEIYKDGKHICPHQSFKNDKSICVLYHEQTSTGICTNSKKQKTNLL